MLQVAEECLRVFVSDVMKQHQSNITFHDHN